MEYSVGIIVIDHDGEKSSRANLLKEIHISFIREGKHKQTGQNDESGGSCLAPMEVIEVVHPGIVETNVPCWSEMERMNEYSGD